MAVGANGGTSNASSQHRQGSRLLPVMLPLSSHHLGLPTASDLSSATTDGDQPLSTVQFPAFPGCFADSMTPVPLLQRLLSPSPYSPSFLSLWSSLQPQKLCVSESQHPFPTRFWFFFSYQPSFHNWVTDRDRAKRQPGCSACEHLGILHQNQRLTTTQPRQRLHQSLQHLPATSWKCSCPLCRGRGHGPSPALEFCQEHRSSQCQIGFCGFSNVVCGFANVGSFGDIFSVSGRELNLQLR